MATNDRKRDRRAAAPAHAPGPLRRARASDGAARSGIADRAPGRRDAAASARPNRSRSEAKARAASAAPPSVGRIAAASGDPRVPASARAGAAPARTANAAEPTGGANSAERAPEGVAESKRRNARAVPPPVAPTAAERRRALEVIDRLDDEMPDAHIELDYGNELELLVAVMLSAQCTDAMVNRCTPSLFAAYRTAADYAAAKPEDLYPHISRCGLSRNKAKNIVAAMQVIEREYGGRLPQSREALEKLPGVGRKTAGVVAVHAFGGQAFPVDTHVGRLARRLGFTSHENPDAVELDMQRLLPPERWAKGHQLLVWHGRRCCFARRPACSRCPVASLCPRIGVVDAV
jgi:endonuclease-3